MGGQRVGEADLVDHPDLERQVHAHHAQVGEKDCVRTFFEPVGGPLPTMRANAPLHLRFLVDLSCVEVYTGTGEVSR